METKLPQRPACLKMDALADAWPWKCRQALVVRTAGWEASVGVLRLFSLPDAAGFWRHEPGEIPVVLGRSGLAWGRGIHSLTEAERPRKQEGDGKSPAGIFRLREAFGYAPPEEVPRIRLPYRRVTRDALCIDDPASALYNRIVEGPDVVPDWKSSETMFRDDGLYSLGAVIGHNEEPVLAGAGSCIFLHIWRGPSRPTEGCTALEAGNLGKILGWLDPEARPVLIQLPEEEYGKRRRPWCLPY